VSQASRMEPSGHRVKLSNLALIWSQRACMGTVNLACSECVFNCHLPTLGPSGWAPPRMEPPKVSIRVTCWQLHSDEWHDGAEKPWMCELFLGDRRHRCAVDLRNECAISRQACICGHAGCLLLRWSIAFRRRRSLACVYETACQHTIRL
jgi:hypothetical protein